MTRHILEARQAMSLELKERLTLIRIKQFYEYYNGKVYVSFSGGKDSTVLLHLARSIYPNIQAVFLDTGLEFPEIREFVKTIPNVKWIKPKLTFKQVLEKYGYPVVTKEVSQKLYEIRNTKSNKLRNKRLYGDEKGNGIMAKKWRPLIDAPFKISHNCCNALKKYPVKSFERKSGLHPIIGTMVNESTLRSTVYLQKGCNSFDNKRPMSTPIAYWLEKDIWNYIKKYKIKYSPIYDMGYKRTGCMFCMFGVHLEKGENRFQRMKKTHPKLYDYCINTLKLGDVLDFMEVDY